MVEHIHFIGIGGIGMSAIAQLLAAQAKVKVSGCDIKENELIEGLRRAGICVWQGHDSKHLEGVDTIVYSTAITQDNIEMQEARRRHLKIMKRAQILAQLMNDKTVITVTGMHGKTTTASLASHLLSEAGLFPTAAVGGILQNFNNNALSGPGRFFVAEADESDGSFLYYTPDYSIITNIDSEHLDYYRNFSSIKDTFKKFIGQTKENGCLFCCQDDLVLASLLKTSKKQIIWYGMSKDADCYALNASLQGLVSEFDCFYKGVFLDRFTVGLAGKHNILNTLAVVALGLELGIDPQIIKRALAQYQGTRRRLEVKFQSEQFLVLDDYGHHPTEIKATLEAVNMLNHRNLLVIFQPHRYTRTKFLLDSFSTCFDVADTIVITDVYPAGESPIEGVSGKSIYERIVSRNQHSHACFLPREEIKEYILNTLKPQDIILVLGAGDITKISDELAKDLYKRQAGT